MIVTLNKNGVVHLQKMTLFPGANNEIDAKAFAEELKHPIVKAMVEAGDISYEESELASPLPEEQYLLKMKPKEAIDLVEKTINSELLSAWLKVENRPAVKKALEAQIKELGTAAKEE